jgi:hypothetical protein
MVVAVKSAVGTSLTVTLVKVCVDVQPFSVTVRVTFLVPDVAHDIS